MKTSILSVGILLFSIVPLAQADGGRERTQGPCYSVNIQNDRVNQSDVKQDCDMNFSRTVQAGKENRAATIQTGDVNSNKVRQYQYEHPRYRISGEHD
ncbi:hypothetical protein [Thiocapsa roseopersicina]|uniref:Uncharacterized protein n=1 Tax=Thiocapsa roseopersicina TaxID=1058 RepID=A0A1H2W7Q5_THIRO|nr:hypothetical protein [Thiocapsa roseopersicina]SDW76555.1 hypothetical protein SAMN05421783_10879 [Thiocapsa roseopersicina]